MTGCNTMSRGYTWQNCDDFQVPKNSVWFGRDDDGSDIFCGKAWCDGEEVPAQIIPNRRECRVIDNGCQRIVPNCRKVLICSCSEENSCHRRRDHCHSHRDHCHGHKNHCRRHRNDRCDDSSTSDSEEDSCTTVKKSNICNNERKVSEKRVKSCSSSTITTVKKSSKKHHKKGESRGEECWYEKRTRIVPKVTVQPRIRYVPKVTNERTVRYVQESYVTRVCGRRYCEPCESCIPCEPGNPCEPCDPCESCIPCEPGNPCEPCDPCESCDPCTPCDSCRSNRKDKTILYSAKSGKKKSVSNRRCSRKSSSRRLRWF